MNFNNISHLFPDTFDKKSTIGTCLVQVDFSEFFSTDFSQFFLCLWVMQKELFKSKMTLFEQLAWLIPNLYQKSRGCSISQGFITFLINFKYFVILVVRRGVSIELNRNYLVSNLKSHFFSFLSILSQLLAGCINFKQSIGLHELTAD